jgi:hypothetical protein
VLLHGEREKALPDLPHALFEGPGENAVRQVHEDPEFFQHVRAGRQCPAQDEAPFQVLDVFFGHGTELVNHALSSLKKQRILYLSARARTTSTRRSPGSSVSAEI